MDFEPVLVHDWLSRSAAYQPRKVALVSGEQRLRYKELDNLSTRLAGSLINLGLTRGQRVVVWLESSVEAVLSIYGTMKAGGVFVILDGRSPWPVVKEIINDAGAGFLVAGGKILKDSNFLSDKISGLKIIITGKDETNISEKDGLFSFQKLLKKIQPAKSKPQVLENDLACLIYTSGSTGKPKGIMCTHHNIISAARSIIQYLGNTEDDVILDVLPLSFDYGLYQVIMCFMFGGRVVLVPNFAYLQDILNLIEKEKVTGLPIIPSISALLLGLKKFPFEPFRYLRYITNTGAAWPVSHIRRLREMLPGVRLFSMYGLTECKRVSYLPPELIDEFPESVGRPMPGLEVAIVDKHGHPVSPGQVGELLVRGPSVMQGYWGDKKLTEKVFRPGKYPEDRWLRTGDLFRQDEHGLLYYMGRRDRQIKSFGHRVSPAEVERVVSGLEGVMEAGAVPVPDEVAGLVIGVFLVVRKGFEFNENRIMEHCRKFLEHYKIPRYVWPVKSLPRTGNGKIDYRKLVSQVPHLTAGQIRKRGQKQ